jgi:hypothetical protein
MMHGPIFDKELREKMEKKPFQPFVIEFDDGRRLVVNRPEALMFPSWGNTVFFHGDGNLDLVDCELVKQFVDLVPANAQ